MLATPVLDHAVPLQAPETAVDPTAFEVVRKLAQRACKILPAHPLKRSGIEEFPVHQTSLLGSALYEQYPSSGFLVHVKQVLEAFALDAVPGFLPPPAAHCAICFS